jgi:hypothetical protein
MAAAGVPADHHAAAVPAAMLPEPCLLPDPTDDDIDAVAAEALAACKGRAAASGDRRPAHDRSLAVGLSPPLDVMLGLRAVTVGAHRAHARVFRASDRRVGGARRRWGGGCGRAGWLDMVGTATIPVAPVGGEWDHLRTAIDTDRIVGAGGRCRPVPSGCWVRPNVGPLRQQGRPGNGA